MWSPSLFGFALMAAQALQGALADTECSADVPCALGCCGQWGVCGMGPDYCGADVCINNCDSKSECDPDNWGSEYANATDCPLNVCCSDYGFCGTTEDFCGDESVTRPSCDVDSQTIDRVIGYYESWASGRYCHVVKPEAIPQGVYTHINFAFGSIDPDTFKVVAASSDDEALYPRLEALKTRDSGLEIWLAIGGWSFNDDTSATVTTFSDLARADITYQRVFFATLTVFMSTWGFSGVDIDWEYPAADDRSGREEDYENFPIFIKNLREWLDEYDYGLSVTLPTSYWYLQHFDLVAMEPYVDWFNYMSYDLHGSWDVGNDWTGAYVNAHSNLTEIETALDLLWRNDIPSDKVNLGLAFYGRSVTLADGSCSEPGCSYLSAGDAGECSDATGVLMNSEIDDIISDNDLTPTLYEAAAVKTIVWNTNQWVSYDDEETFKIKGDFAKSTCLGGVMVWAISQDNSVGDYGIGLASALGREITTDGDTGITLTKAQTASDDEGQDKYCRWANCADGCPDGFTSITRGDDTSQIMMDSQTCKQGGVHIYCCPTSSELPTCRWRGFKNSGRCQSGCNSDEAEVGTVNSGCDYGHQSACCTITESTEPWSHCQWQKTCSTDKEECPSDYPNFVVASRNGEGGEGTCEQGAWKRYCCKDAIPDAFTTCDWYGKVTYSLDFELDSYCEDSCPSGTIRVASQGVWGGYEPAESEDCVIGAESYCCSGPEESSSTDTRSITFSDQTAEEFNAYLLKFFNDPVCPSGYVDDYQAFADDEDAYGNTKRALTVGRSTDQGATLTWLLPVMAAWIASNTPRSDLTEIWDSYSSSYSSTLYDGQVADTETIRNALFPEGYNGEPTYEIDNYIANLLCDVADSYEIALQQYVAETTVCTLSDEENWEKVKRNGTEFTWKHLLTERVFTWASTTQTTNGRGTVIQALRGATNGELSFYYNRWIRVAGNREVILETAYWIGPQANVAPTDAVRRRYHDPLHTNYTDQYVVFHMHIPLDEYTFQLQDGNLYLGANVVAVYQGQFMNDAVPLVYPYSSSEWAEGSYAQSRVEWRASQRIYPSYSTNPASVGYNDRSQVLICPTRANRDTRFYIGLDNGNNIAGVESREDFATALNSWGIHLFEQNYFRRESLAFLWPSVSTSQTVANGRDAFNPVNDAFNYNWE